MTAGGGRYDRPPVDYPVESFTEAQRERLRPHFTNLDRPVSALVNLPETVKAALFARYSRYPGTLRQLFLDEFADDLPPAGGLGEAAEGKRAAQLYERIFLGYGDDSVAQLGGAHVACVWVSNFLTMAHPLPEAREYGWMILEELKAVVPSFLTRVERPDRGGRWIQYLEARTAAAARWAARLGLDGADAPAGPSVTLLRHEGEEEDLLAALLFESGASSEQHVRDAIGTLDAEARAALLADLAGRRTNRRHRPGRGLETLRYRFEIVADYGAFRDLQRHRMLTIQWQPLTPDLGADVPEQVDLAGCGEDYRRALEVSRREYERLHESGLADAARYALCLGYRIRFILDLNAREAMQMIELRSGREGHPSYRAVAHEMHAEIASVHPAVAAAMVHIDRQAEPRLERILSEMRSHARAGERG